MKHVIILGGGLAGLSAAVFLTEKKIPVTLLEASSRLGGRVSSFYDPLINSIVDNGQHIMMGCYTNTIEYINIIDGSKNFYYQKNLEVNFFKEGKIYPLKTDKGVYPLGLIAGLLSFRLLAINERINLLKFMLMIPLSSRRDLEKLNAEMWLVNAGQNENVRNVFWKTFIVGALNTSMEKASALLLRKVLLQVFFGGKYSSSIIIPNKPLTQAFCDPAVSFLQAHNSEVNCSERILRLVPDRKNRVIESVITSKRIIRNFTHIISAVPHHALNKLIRLNYLDELKLVYSSILTAHFKSNQDLFSQKFIAIIDSPIHWIFRHFDHYTIVISSADAYTILDNNEIKKMICGELTKLFNIKAENISSFRIIKEKRATFIPSSEMLNRRPKALTNYNNLFLAGDWTNTGLPATIEGAVLSGRIAAELFN